MNVKICRKCDQAKPVEEFGRRKDARDGLHSYCKECNRAAVKKWAAENPVRKFGDACRHHTRRKEKVSYKGAHQRVLAMYGPARGYSCVFDCGNQAEQWAYSGLDPEAQFGKEHPGTNKKMWWSSNPIHYYPQCRKCHASYDQNLADVRDAYAAVKRFMGTVNA